MKRSAADLSCDARPPEIPATTVDDIAAQGEGDATTEHIYKYFSSRIVGSTAAIVPIVNEDDGMAPSNMKQTMSVKHSAAMVNMLKNSGDDQSSISSGKGTTVVACFGRVCGKAFGPESEFSKNKAEFVEEMKKLATLRHQCGKNKL